MSVDRRDEFVHLHLHSVFSMLDGAAHLDAVMDRVAGDGQRAVGLTDHGNLHGAFDFWRAARARDLNPVIGCEFYMADDRATRLPRGQDQRFHLTALAVTNEGLANLTELSSRSFTEGFYYKPRVDWDLLADHAKGLVILSGCLGGMVAKAVAAGDEDRAAEIAARLRDLADPDSFFVELMDHGTSSQQAVTPGLLRVAERVGAPLVATNDCHYVDHSHAVAHDALLCVQTGAQLSDHDRFRFDGDQYWVKTAAEMRALFPGDVYPGACDNTLAIAERADLSFDTDRSLLPAFPIPDGFGSDVEYLEHLTWEGARQRWGDTLDDDTVERVRFELDVIARMGFSSYFLIVWDLVRHARSSGIRVGPGRGSAAGCAVAYCLRVTDLDPIRYGLLFERFLNPSRVSMPDIDMDFDSRYRDEMIRYTVAKYGDDRVARVVTFGRIKARAAVRDAARVLGLPYAAGDRIAKAMPPLAAGRDTPLRACVEKTEGHESGYKAAGELRRIVAADPEAAKVVDVALGLEGVVRQSGIHAAAVVIAPGPLTDYLPVMIDTGDTTGEASLVTQYEMGAVESLGLLKMDFLGLRNLDILDRACALIAETGVTVDIDEIPLDDPATFAMLQAGESVGVFQLESPPMRALMRSLAPTSFDDIAALVALYRPGPMAANMHNQYADRKNGREEVTFPHPDLAEVLGDTYGLMIYQESMMKVAQTVAGYTLAEADLLRKACGKKIRSLLAAEREKFVAGCDANGYGAALGERLFDIIEPFADYAFNKSHAYGYGLVAYQTAWLKRNHPRQYMASLLTSVADDQERMVGFLAECRRMGLAVAPPDVNRSGVEFTVDGDDIVFALSGIRGVGVPVAAAVVAERDANGPYTGPQDFCRRMPPATISRATIEALAAAGAFDSFGHTRAGISAAAERLVADGNRHRSDQAAGVMSLFDGAADDTPAAATDVPIGDETQARPDELNAEREMLGVYLSGHPLDGHDDAVALAAQISLADLLAVAADPAAMSASGWGGVDPADVRVAGVVTVLDRRVTRKGEQMASFVLDDRTGRVDALVFPKAYPALSGRLAAGAPVAVTGRLTVEDDSTVKLFVADITALDLEASEHTGAAHTTGVWIDQQDRLRIDLVGLEQDRLFCHQVRVAVNRHPGSHDVLLRTTGANGPALLRIQDRCRPAPELLHQLRRLRDAAVERNRPDAAA